VFTTVDKALVALIGAVLALLNMLFGISLFGEHAADVVEAIVVVLTPILVWLVPNRVMLRR
jgi:uncharacterized membrane protein